MFITGHTGFKGAWLSSMLLELGASPSGYSLAPPTSPALFDQLGLADRMDHVVGDIRDQAALEAAMQAADPEVVIHMAAQPLVRSSYSAPVETYATNVMGTVHVLEACRSQPSLRSIVVVTTDKCYENKGWTWGYRELDRLGGADPYSSSKAACELVVSSWRDSFFSAAGKGQAGLASARAGNVIGGGDFALDRLVPDAMRAFAAGDELLIRNRLSIRPWQHVLEPLWGYLLLAERLHADLGFASGWNFGPRTDESARVEVVVDSLARLWGGNARWVQDHGEHPHEAATLKLDCTKAMVELGWTPRLQLENALELTAEWYKTHAAGGDIGRVTTNQIKQYLSEVGAA